MESKSLRLYTDRTTIETDWDCGMKRYWYREHDGTGIVPVEQPVYYADGTDVHSDLAKLMTGTDLATVLSTIPTPDEGAPVEIFERWSRRIGWVTAFATWMMPFLNEHYETVMAEKELIHVYRSPSINAELWTAFTADLVLRAKSDRRLVVFDYKSVSILGRGWVNHWPYAIQMHINIDGIMQEMKEEPKYAQVVGLYKGQDRQGKLRHPYVWAYYNTETDTWSADYKYGWSLRAVWEYPGGTEAFVLFAGRDVGMEQFPFSAPIPLDRRLLDGLLEDRLKREMVLSSLSNATLVDESARRTYYEPRYSKCVPSIGAECPYKAACHNAVVGADPIGSGLYVPRDPHHDVELVLRRDEDV